VTGDFNGDSIPDLATIRAGANEVTVRLGQPDGTLAASQGVAVGTSPKAIVSADFNGDGLADLAVANKASRDVSVLLGQGDGTFQHELRSPVGGAGPDVLFVQDFNGDGLLDLATMAWDNNAFSILLGHGDGTFDVPGLPPLAEADTLMAVAPAASGDPGGSLVGGAEGPFLTQQYAGGGVLSATTVLGRADEEPAPLPGDGQALNMTLATFGNAFTLPACDEPRPPLPDILMLGGQDAAPGVDVLAEADAWTQAGEAVVPGRRTARAAGAAVAPGPLEESAWNAFRMVLEDVFRPSQLDGLPGRREADLRRGASTPPPSPSHQERATPGPEGESEARLEGPTPESLQSVADEKTEAPAAAQATLGCELVAGLTEEDGDCATRTST
jgi:hypothetical protein